jgi:tetratricopeptide (TPR) repeat protein/predicted aspartyl protease
MPHLNRASRRPRPWTAGGGALAAVALALVAHPARAAAVCKLHKLLELPVTMVGTQPTVPVTLNGKPARFLVDTGAFFSLITPAAAARYALKVVPDYRLEYGGVIGAGGRAEAKVTNVADFGLGGVSYHAADLVVVDGLGRQIEGVLGQNLLGSADVEYDLANGVVRIFKPEQCADRVLAYWAESTASRLDMIVNTSDPSHKIEANGSLNGQKLRVMFDTGASRSILTLKAAERAGVTPQSPGVVSGGQTSGIGPRLVDTWIARFDSFKLDLEEIQHTRMRMGAIELSDADMLLGADFFLSHRIYVANSQGRIYFTYSGGQVFQLEATPRAASTDQTAAGQAQASAADTPTDAAGFSRRGAADLARFDYPHAIEDFTRAHELEPNAPDPLYGRGRARMAAGQPVPAKDDFDTALRLKPDDVPVLLARARLTARSGDKAQARADLDAATRFSGADPVMSLTVASAYMADGFLEDAVTRFDGWIAANPRSDQMSDALNARCFARGVLKTGLDMALADCNAALRLKPGQAATLDSVGFVRLQRGEFDAAITAYDASLRARPQAAITLYGRGVAKLRKGLKDAGEADIQAATAINPRIADQARRFGVTP